MRRSVRLVVLSLVALCVAPSAASAARGDTARYILPPGNFGGLPTNADSLDQLPLYDALTPKRGRVTSADINRLFLPENFKPIGRTRTEQTGRPGLRLVYDEYGVPHVYGKTRADLAFGAGWASARDRGLLLQLARGTGAGGGGGRTRNQRLQPRHERPVVRPEPGDRGARDRSAAAAGPGVWRQGAPDHRGRAGLCRWHQRLLEGQRRQPEPGHGQRHPRGDGIHRLDLRCRRWSRGGQRGSARSPARIARPLAWPGGLGGRDARGRSRGAHHDLPPLRLRTPDRREGEGIRGARPRLHPTVRSTTGRRRARQRERGVGAARPAGLELPGRGARALQDRQLPRGHGSPARLLLPSHQLPDRPSRPGDTGAGRCGAGPGYVPPTRADEELRLEPHLGRPRRARRVRRAAVRAGRRTAHASLDPLPPQGPLPAVRRFQCRASERGSRSASRPRSTVRSPERPRWRAGPTRSRAGARPSVAMP